MIQRERAALDFKSGPNFFGGCDRLPACFFVGMTGGKPIVLCWKPRTSITQHANRDRLKDDFLVVEIPIFCLSPQQQLLVFGL